MRNKPGLMLLQSELLVEGEAPCAGESAGAWELIIEVLDGDISKANDRLR